MKLQTHPLAWPSLGNQKHVTSFHFGTGASGQKAYLQASLHADELPGMLVLQQLRPLLEDAEQSGRIQGEIVLVPVANPIGLSQSVLYHGFGRFELATAQNFNRGFPDFLALLGDSIERELGSDADVNRINIRRLLRDGLDRLEPTSEVDSLRILLARLACDADVVLDLHCDEESIMHLYTERPYWSQAEPLARYLGAQASLLAMGQGARSFDEALSGVWWQLEAQLRTSEVQLPIPLACFSATVELRGQADVELDLARADAQHLYDFLQYRGMIEGKAPDLPELLQPATPLAGSEDVRTPHAGVLYFLKRPGDWIDAGQVVAEVVDPLLNRTSPICATVSGVLYGRMRERYAAPHRVVCRIAGAKEFRSGNLLSP